jgi:hypothetical protein
MATNRDDDEGYRLPTNVIEGRRAGERADGADAFMPDPEEGPAQIDDDIAETLAEDFLQAATSGQDAVEESLDGLVEEELGGPFIVTTADEEFAASVDSMNPEDATREPLPRVNGGLYQPSAEAYVGDIEEDEEREDDGP